MFIVVRYKSLLLLLFIALLTSCGNRVYDDGLDRNFSKKAEELYLNGHRGESVRYLDSVYAGRDVSPLGRYLIYSQKAQYYYELPDLERSMLYADSSINVLKKSRTERRYVKEYAHALLEKGHIYTALSKYDDAYKCYLEGYSFMMTTANRFAMHEFDYHIGMTLYKQGKRDEARNFFIRSFHEANACAAAEKPYYRMQELLSNIALTDSGETQRAALDSCMKFIRHNQSQFPTKEMTVRAIAVCYANKGMSFYKSKMYSQAAECIQECIKIYETADKRKYDGVVFDAQLDLGSVFYHAGWKQKFVQLWNEIRSDTDLIDGGLTQSRWYKMRYMYYEITGDYKNALYAYRVFNEYVDAQIAAEGDPGVPKDVLKEMENREQAYKIRLLTKDGQLQRIYLWILIGAALLTAGAVVLIYTSYQKTRRSNILISSQKAALEQSNREKNRIMNVVAHDLRNPVSAVAYLADSVIEDEDESSIKSVAALKLIKESSLNSLQLINELATLANDEQQLLQFEQTDINSIVEGAAQLLEEKAKKKDVTISLSLPSVIVAIQADRNRLGRVMRNLVDNAIKFSKTGGKVEIKVTRDNEALQIVVEDKGIGIPEQLLPELFELFTPSGRMGTNGEKSFGLGLSISRQIIEAHGGKIWVESEEGEGSEFYVQLPV